MNAILEKSAHSVDTFGFVDEAGQVTSYESPDWVIIAVEMMK